MRLVVSYTLLCMQDTWHAVPETRWFDIACIPVYARSDPVLGLYRPAQ